jgi:formylglycine-generating enzyme required for sulfatase activity
VRIPAGPFLFGSSDADVMAYGDEKPQRTIDLPEYWIGRYPVTNAQYKRFLDAKPGHRVPFVDADWAKAYNWDEKARTYPAGKDDHPVVLVSWDDAKAFCDWAGLALPSEEQWEKAARGADGRLWPWGNEDPTAAHCNFNRNVDTTTPAAQYSPKGDSPYGCADMAGNVWEWTESWYDEAKTRRVVRGGSWLSSRNLARAAYRYSSHPVDRPSLLGFRVVRRPPSPAL